MEGRTLEALFRNAARAASALMVEPALVQGGGLRDRIHAEAPDRGALLAKWVGLVLGQLSANRLLIAGVQSLSVRPPAGARPWSLEAVTDGEPLDPLRHGRPREFKSAVLEELAGDDGEGWRARLVLLE